MAAMESVVEILTVHVVITSVESHQRTMHNVENHCSLDVYLHLLNAGCYCCMFDDHIE